MPNSLGKFALFYNIFTGETSPDKPAFPAYRQAGGRQADRAGGSELFPSDLNLKLLSDA
ncbi:MAG: hypothetical protein WBG58_10495 [Ignavibacteriaceae bacterium]